MSRRGRAELALWVCGAILLAAWGAVHVWGGWSARRDIARFDAAAAAAAPVAGPEWAAPAVDTSLWSDARRKRYEAARATIAADAPLAVLRIDRIGLEVPVLEGTDEITLDRAVGHIEGTPRPGESGNAGIAGHRDGFFRGLKDVARGDRIELRTAAGAASYAVTELRVVSPEDVSVLAPTDAQALTLVTCYPFYFVGPAPQRYVVRAVRR